MISDAERCKRNIVIRELLTALDQHNPGELAHANRVAVYSVALAEASGLDDERLLDIRYAAMLHDIGKIRLDASLWRRMGTLTSDELWRMRLHSLFGVRVLESIPWLENALPLVQHHHERWDGSGYPQGLSREAIPLGARIIAIAEVFDLLLFPPPWKAGMSEAEALAELQYHARSQFDPKLVPLFAKIQPLIQPVSFEPA
jgi:HD-GYP domain-containing protein (c-di-GMP phosphodiesterase class II)